MTKAKLPQRNLLLMVYEGSVTGSMAGRDDGYPQTKYVIVDLREELVQRYVKGCDLYECTQVDAEQTLAEAKLYVDCKEDAKAEKREVAAKKKRLSD